MSAQALEAFAAVSVSRTVAEAARSQRQWEEPLPAVPQAPVSVAPEVGPQSQELELPPVRSQQQVAAAAERQAARKAVSASAW